MALTRILCAAVMALGVAQAGAASEEPMSLEHGYRLMYELDFESAGRVFLQWRVDHPRDPLGPVSQAANLLFMELNRSGVLQAQFFVDNKSFTGGKHPTVPPDVRARFEAAVADAEAVARARLAEDPRNHDALFALAMTFGLRADFAGLLDGRNMAALSYSRQATRVARTLIELAPDYADAYLATGVSQFIVGSLIAPMRWVLRLAGFDGDKTKGMQQVRLTAEGGRFLGPFARILLAIACLREHDTKGARELLAGLARDFPSNPLFARELQRIPAKAD
jgi:hypothetical protein